MRTGPVLSPRVATPGHIAPQHRGCAIEAHALDGG
jgi:hypothetical protein